MPIDIFTKKKTVGTGNLMDGWIPTHMNSLYLRIPSLTVELASAKEE